MVVTIDKRSLVYDKVLAGWNRIAVENPSIDWTLDTPETEAAEEKLWAAKENYENGNGTLAEVKQAFDMWALTQINKSNVQSLF